MSVFTLLYANLLGQENFTIKKDLRSEWMTYEQGAYKPSGSDHLNGRNTLYLQIVPEEFPGSYLRIKSERPFFVFINSRINGEYKGSVAFDLDSLRTVDQGRLYTLAIHQRNINERDLKTAIISKQRQAIVVTNTVAKPASYFRDFVVVAGILIILLFLVILRINPKLAADYFSVARIFSAREGEDSQSSARLTSSSNVQFYILCSMMMALYLMIILKNLPSDYALPVHFQATGFWMISWQWIKLGIIIFSFFVFKIIIIFLLTRLFGMRGMARFHFFNWIRLLLIVFGTATIILFMYFISRGESEDFFVVFLSLVVIILIVWIVVAFFKLSGRSEHSMFHLFSYICATEIIPLLITVKVLFQ